FRPAEQTSCFPATTTTFNDTHSLHDALPIFAEVTSTPFNVASNINSSPTNSPSDSSESFATNTCSSGFSGPSGTTPLSTYSTHEDRKSTRLNSSHVKISYAVFCLKKKKNQHS